MTDKPSDIELLADILKKERVPLQNFRHRDHLRSAIAVGGYNGGNAGARTAFYDNSRRQQPSLPRLKFLEGK